MNLLDQLAVEFDGKRDQALRLLELALFAARRARTGRTAKAIRRAGLFHLAREFQAFVSVEIRFLHGFFLDCLVNTILMVCAIEATPSALRRTNDSISDAAAIRLFHRGAPSTP